MLTLIIFVIVWIGLYVLVESPAYRWLIAQWKRLLFNPRPRRMSSATPTHLMKVSEGSASDWDARFPLFALWILGHIVGIIGTTVFLLPSKSHPFIIGVQLAFIAVDVTLGSVVLIWRRHLSFALPVFRVLLDMYSLTQSPRCWCFDPEKIFLFAEKPAVGPASPPLLSSELDHDWNAGFVYGARLTVYMWSTVGLLVVDSQQFLHWLAPIGWGLVSLTAEDWTSMATFAPSTSTFGCRGCFGMYAASVLGSYFWFQFGGASGQVTSDFRVAEDRFLVWHLLVPVSIVSLAARLSWKEHSEQAVYCGGGGGGEGAAKTTSMISEELQNIAASRGLSAEIAYLKKKASYVSSLAHEVRTPLNALLSCCTLLSDTSLTEEQLEYVNMMITCGSQISNNVDYVLELARLDENMVRLESKPMNICEVCTSAMEMVRHLAEKKKLKLEFHCPCAILPPMLLGDPNRLKQVLMNLMTNSIKFTTEGSVSIVLASVVLEGGTSSEQSGRRRAGFSNATHHTNSSEPSVAKVLIQISDTGIGMSPEQQAKLFQPFQQANNQTWGAYGGSGLGLVISQQLVHMMGGTIRINAERTRLDLGSCIDVEISFKIASVDAFSSMQSFQIQPLSRGEGISLHSARNSRIAMIQPESSADDEQDVHYSSGDEAGQVRKRSQFGGVSQLPGGITVTSKLSPFCSYMDAMGGITVGICNGADSAGGVTVDPPGSGGGGGGVSQFEVSQHGSTSRSYTSPSSAQSGAISNSFDEEGIRIRTRLGTGASGSGGGGGAGGGISQMSKSIATIPRSVHSMSRSPKFAPPLSQPTSAIKPSVTGSGLFVDLRRTSYSPTSGDPQFLFIESATIPTSRSEDNITHRSSSTNADDLESQRSHPSPMAPSQHLSVLSSQFPPSLSIQLPSSVSYSGAIKGATSPSTVLVPTSASALVVTSATQAASLGVSRTNVTFSDKPSIAATITIVPSRSVNPDQNLPSSFTGTSSGEMVVAPSSSALGISAVRAGSKPSAQHAPPEPRSLSVLDKFCVMVVDDNSLNITLMVRLLRTVGFGEILQAKDGQDAYEQFEAHNSVDLILTDLEMPRLDGYGLSRRIRARAAHMGRGLLGDDHDRRPAIAALSGAVCSEAVEQCCRVGMDAFIQKPVTRAQLQRIAIYLLTGNLPNMGGPGGGGSAPELVSGSPECSVATAAAAKAEKDQTTDPIFPNNVVFFDRNASFSNRERSSTANADTNHDDLSPSDGEGLPPSAVEHQPLTEAISEDSPPFTINVYSPCSSPRFGTLQPLSKAKVPSMCSSAGGLASTTGVSGGEATLQSDVGTPVTSSTTAAKHSRQGTSALGSCSGRSLLNFATTFDTMSSCSLNAAHHQQLQQQLHPLRGPSAQLNAFPRNPLNPSN